MELMELTCKITTRLMANATFVAELEDVLPVQGRKQPHSMIRVKRIVSLAHSQDVADQQKAATDLNTLIGGNAFFPMISFAPMAHALCRLLPSHDRTVVYFAARAAKTLLLDDALRGQAVLVGLPAVLLQALQTWQEETPCLREILGSLQTLSWDKHTVKSLIACLATEYGQSTGKNTEQAGSPGRKSAQVDSMGLIPYQRGAVHTKQDISSTEERDAGLAPAAHITSTQPMMAATTSVTLPSVGRLASILALLQTRDLEVVTLSLAIVANLCAYSDTYLLTHQGLIHAVRDVLPRVLEVAQNQSRLLRCYGVATLANASANPVLLGRMKELGGGAVVEKIEQEDLKANTVAFGGTRVSECCEVVLLRLAGGKHESLGGSVASGNRNDDKLHDGGESGRVLLTKKFKFKYGNTPTLELTLDGNQNRTTVVICIFLWVVCILLFLQPILRPRKTGGLGN